MVVIIPFLNEEEHLGTLLDSIAAQTRPPDELLLVDDGSTDASPEIAAAFADEHAYVRLVLRPSRPPDRDRLARAPELEAFQWAVGQVKMAYGVIAKMDADLRLTPETFAATERQFESDPKLGMTGPYLGVIGPDGRSRRERCPRDHIRGATKFYRRECFEQIAPLPVTLGWDTLDEIKARMHGWRAASFELPGGDPLHLRPTGAHDGALRTYRRAGLGAWAYGAHPVHVLLGALRRAKDPPWLVGGLSYLLAWALAAARRVPRSDPEVRAFIRREQLGRLRRLVTHRREA
ncbi:MAG: glycosyltransferase family A protein [Solirubrobacteraceae bacterium]